MDTRLLTKKIKYIQSTLFITTASGWAESVVIWSGRYMQRCTYNKLYDVFENGQSTGGRYKAPVVIKKVVIKRVDCILLKEVTLILRSYFSF